MRKITLAFVLLAALAAGVGDAVATELIKPMVQVRWRWESSKRDFNKNTAFNNYNLLRSRLAVKITPGEDIEGFIQLQDSRVWGEEWNTLLDGSADNFDLHQGYFKIHDFFKAPLDVKVGRQVVKYGTERLIGAVDWNNVGRSFDGLIFDVHGKKFWVDLFNFQVVDSLKTGDYKDLFMYGGYADIKAHENHKTQLFAVWQRRQPRRMLNRGTVGAYLEGNFGAFSYESDLGYQFGDITTSNTDTLLTGEPFADATQSVGAYMVTLKLGYTARVRTNPGVFLAVDFLSGDDDLQDDKYKVFDTLYGTNHKFYGFMDYFVIIPLNTFGRGLVDTWGRLKATPVKKTPMMLDVHYFQADKDVLVIDSSGTTNVGKKFGTEVDFTISHAYAENLSFLLGASWFGPGNVFKTVRGQDDSWWFYVMATFNV
jgi:hypothetical protein